MSKYSEIKKAKYFILLGIFFIFISAGFLVYYFIDLPPLLTYDITAKAVVEPKIEETNWQIEIPRIGVTAPVLININGNDEIGYLKALEQGVAHLKGTSIPGNIGNIFIFGHSSNFIFSPGDYKYIFAKLDELEINDEIIIKSNIKKYTYQVFEKKVINPIEVEVTETVKEGKETLTLMTCTPVGTSLQRLIIISDRTN